MRIITMVFVLSGLITSCHGVELLPQATISGRLEKPDGTNIAPKSLLWCLSGVHELEHDKSPKLTDYKDREIRPRVDADSNFEIRIDHGYYYPVGGYYLTAYSNGWLGVSDKFNLTVDANVVTDIKIKLAIKCDKLVKVRIVDPVSLAPIAKMKFEIHLHPDSFEHIAYKNLLFTEAKTDDNGYLTAGSLPEGSVSINLSPTVFRVKDDWQDEAGSTVMPAGKYIRKTKFATLSKEPADAEVPIVYYISKRKSMFWDNYGDDKGNRCKPGDIVEIVKIADFTNPAKNNEKVNIQVTVDKDGILKTPVIPVGLYEFKIISWKEPYKKEECLFWGGFESNFNLLRHKPEEETEAKPK